MKYIDAEKLIAEIESRMEDCKLPNGKFPSTTNIVRYEELSCLRNYIASLLPELPERPEIAEYYYNKGVYEGFSQGRADALKMLKEFMKRKADPVIAIKQQEQPEVFDTVAFQKGVEEGRRLEKEDAEHLRDATKKISEDLEDAK